jgi:preprotein translocase subunit SecG
MKAMFKTYVHVFLVIIIIIIIIVIIIGIVVESRPGRDADHSPPSSAEVKNE